MKAARSVIVLVFVAAACSSNDARTGAGEPLVIKTVLEKATVLGQFIPGRLPGTPSTATGGSSGTGEPSTLYASLKLNDSKFYRGQANYSLTGNTSKDVSAVGIAFENVGTGYWVVPIGSLDTATNMPEWRATADIGPQMPAGDQKLQWVGIDGNGIAGPIQTHSICIANPVPDGYQGCTGAKAPPAAVISLSWDANVDLDLQVKAPDGRLIEPKNPLTIDLDAGTTLPADAGKIDRDSNASCSIDNIRYENLVWQNVAPKGVYGIYVNLFDSCKQSSVRFNVQVYSVVDGPDGTTKVLKSWYSKDGILLDFQANGGSNIGLFVTEFDFQ
jgi:hypothetical protein